MLSLVHWLLIALYAAAPILAAGHAFAHVRRRQFAPAARLFTTAVLGASLGAALTVVYALKVGGRAPFSQFVLLIYLATAVLIVLRTCDAILQKGLFSIARRAGAIRAESSLVAPVLLTLVRGLLLLGIGLPYVISIGMVYRPKVAPHEDPMTLLRCAFTPVEFRSTDGVRLSGWWIPADEPSRRARRGDPQFGRKTVLLCHGLASNKSSQLILVRQLVPAGYNVLAFDFRAHGESGGQVSSLGDLERRDVLGAVRWLRENHPERTRRIVGLGHSLGAAALIAAAVDPSTEGQAIQAVAVYDTYDDLDALSRSFARDSFMPPMDWLVRQIGLPLASAHAGTDLADFKPARLVRDLWPRPILVVHTARDNVIDLERGQRLFESASLPRQALWVPMEDQNEVLRDDDVAAAVRQFFDTARPMPAI